jgi:hypothetical protein
LGDEVFAALYAGNRIVFTAKNSKVFS